MRSHRVTSCGVTLSVVLLLFEPVIDAAQSLILNETIDVQGKKVGMQMFTLQCPIHDLSKRDWTPQVSTYTIHLIDRRALPKDVTPRVQANGFFSFNHSAWSYLDYIDENRLALRRHNTARLKCDVLRSESGKLLHYGPCVVDSEKDQRCPVTEYIDRNTSDVVYVDSFTEVHSEGWGTASVPDSQGYKCRGVDTKNNRRPCTIVSYKAPPERLGF